jgi:hypothetical protein
MLLEYEFARKRDKGGWDPGAWRKRGKAFKDLLLWLIDDADLF